MVHGNVQGKMQNGFVQNSAFSVTLTVENTKEIRYSNIRKAVMSTTAIANVMVVGHVRQIVHVTRAD